jgi:subtilisin family serine protease
MDRLRAILRRALPLCAAALAVLGAGSVGSRRPDPPTAAIEDREILVMLRHTPDHLRPGTAYGGDYGDSLTSMAQRRVAQRIAHRNRLDLVQDGWPMPLIGIDCYVMRVAANTDVGTVIAQVSRDPQVVWSQPMQVYRTQGISRPKGGAAGRAPDPLFAAQPAATLWHLADLHRIATGRGVTVAVIDSRIDIHHPDLAGQFAANEDFVKDRHRDPERHGTGIAGVIAARADNGIGIAGIAPDAKLMALRACWQTGADAAAPTLCNTLSLAQALQFAILHDAGVINLSLSGPSDTLLEKLIIIAETRHIAIVAAFDPALPGGGFPASAPGVFAVANESVASTPPGVYRAPGQDIPTTQPGGKWFLASGSSFAAAHISGLIALVREKRASDIKTTLVATNATGGIVDACATLLRLAKPCGCACPSIGRAAPVGM